MSGDLEMLYSGEKGIPSSSPCYYRGFQKAASQVQGFGGTRFRGFWCFAFLLQTCENANTAEMRTPEAPAEG